MTVTGGIVIKARTIGSPLKSNHVFQNGSLDKSNLITP